MTVAQAEAAARRNLPPLSPDASPADREAAVAAYYREVARVMISTKKER